MKIFSSIVLFLIISSCGFKVVNLSDAGFSIIEIKMTGNKRINYLIKNNLSANPVESKNEVIVNIGTQKNKTIKERNIKNEITKYNISITAEVTLEPINSSKSITFSIRENGSFVVGAQNSITRNNEKNLISLLAKEIADEILLEIKLKSNDL